MNKTELIDAIAGKAGLSKADGARALDAFTSVVSANLAKGDAITISGFGSFLVRNRAARTGINPRTKEAIQIPPSRVPTFKAGKHLKDAVKK